MLRWWGRLLCWLDFHKLGETWEVPNPDLPQTETLAECVRCGILFRL